MKHFLTWILLLTLTGCCRIGELPPWTAESEPDSTSTLYRFRLERSAVTKFSGLLALKPRENGMWTALLDATGAPLVKMITHPDGTHQIDYCAVALRDTRLPELLGKMVEYIYFTPASADCPWYTFSCVCAKMNSPEQSVKWRGIGPVHLWEVEQTPPKMKERITVHMKFSSVSVHLQRIDNETGK